MNKTQQITQMNRFYLPEGSSTSIFTNENGIKDGFSIDAPIDSFNDAKTKQGKFINQIDIVSVEQFTVPENITEVMVDYLDKKEMYLHVEEDGTLNGIVASEIIYVPKDSNIVFKDTEEDIENDYFLMHTEYMVPITNHEEDKVYILTETLYVDMVTGEGNKYHVHYIKEKTKEDESRFKPLSEVNLTSHDYAVETVVGMLEDLSKGNIKYN